jgi:hypothetical protein
MTVLVEPQAVFEAARVDTELAYKLRAFSGSVRVLGAGTPFDLVFSDGLATALIEDPDETSDSPAVTWEAPAEFWNNAVGTTLTPGYESLTTAPKFGLVMTGDFATVIAPWQGGWSRLYVVLRGATAGPTQRKPFTDPYRSTDDALGRYTPLPKASRPGSTTRRPATAPCP